MSTAQDLPTPYGEPSTTPTLRLLPQEPLDFEEAVLHLRPRLHRYAVRRLGDTHEAEELVQEALLRAYTHRDQLCTADDLAAWSTVVTGRLVIDRLRVRGRFTPVPDLPETTRVGRDTADLVVARDEARLALDALDAMPSRQAALLWAREVEGQSYDELCTRFGMTEPAVRSVLTRARKALRKEYASRGGTLPVGGLAVLAPWIAGLTWADKLRAAAGRVTAPAALGAASVTVLGGLVLSPFGALPIMPAPQPFSPSRAVVVETNDVLHGFVIAPVAHTPGSAAERTSPVKEQDHTGLISAFVNETKGCRTDTRSPEGQGPISIGGKSIGGASAGGADCAVASNTAGSTIYVDVLLPDNPTGMQYVGVTTNLTNCSTVSANPIVKCTEETTQQGDIK